MVELAGIEPASSTHSPRLSKRLDDERLRSGSTSSLSYRDVDQSKVVAALRAFARRSRVGSGEVAGQSEDALLPNSLSSS